MRLLADTHAFVWYMMGSSRISATGKALIQDPANDVAVSVASIWEMAIKSSLGKLPLAQPIDVLLPAQLHLHRIDLLEIKLPHLYVVATLPMHHRDPFDRLLVAQCQHENLPIVSGDPAFDAYGIQRLW